MFTKYSGAVPRELTWNGAEGLAVLEPVGTGVAINFYDPGSGFLINLCNYNLPIRIYNISTAPPGVAKFPCVDPCEAAYAGAYNNPGPYTGCTSINFPGT